MQGPKSKDQQRLIAIALFLLLLFSLLIIQFFRIQIVQHKEWDRLALAQHTVVVSKPFKRGVFYSNTAVKSSHPSSEQPLVIDVPKFHLYIDPMGISEDLRDAVCRQLALFLELDAAEHAYVRSEFDRPLRSRKIAMWLSGDLKEQIGGWWQGYARKHRVARNALYFVKDYRRSYPFGKLLGQALHSVRELKDEKTQRSIPTGGLELVFNEYLQGKEGKLLFYRSPRHEMDVGKVIETPEDGADVYLTINHYLQAIAEEEIEKQVKKAQAKRGWAIMMDPHSGEILALAQYPFFYPARYFDYFNDPDLQEETHVKGVSHPYEPGSTMKAVTAAVGLLANQEMERRGEPPLFDPIEMVDVLPTSFPGRSKPVRDIRTHKYMNMYIAMQKSSNVYMARIVEKVIEHLGVKWYRDTLENIFGFGKKTGIELPGESPGLLPRPGKVYPNGALEWSLPTPYSLAMGYNILVNSFQMLRAFAIICNGGYDVKPTLVRKIIRKLPDGSFSTIVENTLARGFNRKQLIDSDISRQLVCGLKYVTKEGGAAKKADISGFTQGGKTSTSEKLKGNAYSKKDHFSTFIGFAPADDPCFVLLVAIDEPAYKYIPGVGGNQYGGNCAAPAFKRIGRRTLEFLGVDPDDAHGYPPGDPRRDQSKADWNKEIKALHNLYEAWNR